MMDRPEIKLKRNTALHGVNAEWRETPYRGERTVRLCGRVMRRAYDIPDHISEVVLVFSRRKFANAYKIIVRTVCEGEWSDCKALRLEPVNHSLLYAAHQTAKAMYAQGYRYARIEYDA